MALLVTKTKQDCEQFVNDKTKIPIMHDNQYSVFRTNVTAKGYKN